MSEPIYFYSRSTEYFELSNFAPFGFEADGECWPTVEHYFQAQKFADPKYRERIRSARTPKEAKTLGRTRSLPIRADWEECKEAIMLQALQLKFQNAQLRALLTQTGERQLVENSPFDYYWGCGRNGTGKNRLGHLLMRVRAQIESQRTANSAIDSDTVRPPLRAPHGARHRGR